MSFEYGSTKNLRVIIGFCVLIFVSLALEVKFISNQDGIKDSFVYDFLNLNIYTYTSSNFLWGIYALLIFLYGFFALIEILSTDSCYY